MYFYCLFWHREQESRHHLIVKDEDKNSALVKAWYEFEKAFSVSLESYELEVYEIKNGVFIID